MSWRGVESGFVTWGCLDWKTNPNCQPGVVDDVARVVWKTLVRCAAGPMFHNLLYQLGCPVWNCVGWKGTVYQRRSPQANWLREYSRVFGTVEGNSTFYGLPTLERFEIWANHSVEGFQFCPKVPRLISHDQQLAGGEAELQHFLDGMRILQRHQKLGRVFLQLGPRFGPDKLPRLAQFLECLRPEFPVAVEVRHPEWFDDPAESALNQLLTQLEVDRVIFDSRALFKYPPADESESRSRQRKPRVPIRTRVTGSAPMLRLIGRNDTATLGPAIEEWSEIVALWIRNGLRPFVFTHTPDDRHAPDFARRFHQRLAQELPELEVADAWPAAGPQQQRLW